MCVATGADKNAAVMAECVQSSQPGVNPLNPCPGLVCVCKLSTRPRRAELNEELMEWRQISDGQHAMHHGRRSPPHVCHSAGNPAEDPGVT